MGLKIREARKKDLDEILKLDLNLLDYEAKIDTSLKSSNQKIKEFEKDFIIKKFNDKNARIFIAMFNFKIIGFCYGFVQKLDPNHRINPVGYLCSCYVKGKYRGRGIGEQLANKLINWFKSKRIKRVVLDVTKKNINAIKVWRKLGFKDHPWKRMCLDV